MGSSQALSKIHLHHRLHSAYLRTNSFNFSGNTSNTSSLLQARILNPELSCSQEILRHIATDFSRAAGTQHCHDQGKKGCGPKGPKRRNQRGGAFSLKARQLFRVKVLQAAITVIARFDFTRMLYTSCTRHIMMAGQAAPGIVSAGAAGIYSQQGGGAVLPRSRCVPTAALSACGGSAGSGAVTMTPQALWQ